MLEKISRRLSCKEKTTGKGIGKIVVPAAACAVVFLAAAVTLPSFWGEEASTGGDYSSEIARAPVDSVECTLYLPNQSMTGLDTVQAELEGTADALLEALAERNVLPEGIRFQSFRIENDGVESREKVGDSEIVSYQIGKNTVAFADLPASFVDYLNALDGQAEQLTVKSIVVTFIENYHLTGMKITVDGAPLTTERNDYSAELKR